METANLAEPDKKRGLLRATLCFWDESGYSERPVVRRTWGRRGCTPIVQSTGSWRNISATGIIATDVRGRRVRALCTFTVGAIRKENTIQMIRHLLRHVHGPVVLIWDGLAQHRSRVVREFLRTRAKRIVMVARFPAYAPELNPQEYLWAASKTKDLAGYVPADTDSLLTRARQSIRRIQRSPDILRGALYRSGLFTRGS